MLNKKHIHLLDTSLRDGSHAVSHSYTADQIMAIAEGMDKAGVEYIEVSHGDGLAASSVNYGFAKLSDKEMLMAASSVGCSPMKGMGQHDNWYEGKCHGKFVRNKLGKSPNAPEKSILRI